VSTTYGEQAAVRGDPDALDDLALTCRSTARALRADAARLRRADVGGWSGEGARAFMRSLHGLPRDLSLAADSYDTVASALSTYAAELRPLVARARRAESELAYLSGLLLVDRQHLLGGLDPASDEVRVRRITAHEEEHTAVRGLLGSLGAEAELAAGAAAGRIRCASDAPQEPPGLLERLADAAGDWVEDHAPELEAFSAALKVISTVSLALSMVTGPVGVFFRCLGSAAGVAAVFIDAALAARGRASWGDVAMDAIGVAVPGIAKARRSVEGVVERGVSGFREERMSRTVEEGSDQGASSYRELRSRRGSVVVYRVEGTANTRVVIDAERNVTFRGRRMLFLTVGDRARAENYYWQKREGGLPGVQLKAFRIPKQYHRQLSIEAVDQHLAKAFPDRPQRVDVSKSSEQYGLRKVHFREMEKHILPRSGRILR
jgi:hypothetical protein